MYFSFGVMCTFSIRMFVCFLHRIYVLIVRINIIIIVVPYIYFNDNVSAGGLVFLFDDAHHIAKVRTTLMGMDEEYCECDSSPTHV